MVSFATTLYTWFHMQPRYIDDGFIPRPPPSGLGSKFIHNHAICMVFMCKPRYIRGFIWQPRYTRGFHSQPRYIAWFHMQPRYIDDVFIPLPPPSGLGSKFTHNHDICMVSFATTLYTWFHMQPRYIDDVFIPLPPLRPWDQNPFATTLYAWFHSQPRYIRGSICNHAIHVVSFATTLYTWFHMQPRYIDDVFIPLPPLRPWDQNPFATTLYAWFHSQPRYIRGSICNHAIHVVSFATTLYSVVPHATTLYRRRLHTPPTPLGPAAYIVVVNETTHIVCLKNNNFVSVLVFFR